MRFLRRLVIGASLAAAPLSASAQEPDNLVRVSGTVFDSVAMRPAAGAMVQLVPREAPFARPYETTADAQGRYEILARAGRYLLGFMHRTLDSLNLASPVAQVDLVLGSPLRADLAVPPPRQIAIAACGGNPRDSVGAVLGVLRDARTGATVNGGRVFASWTDLLIGSEGIRSVEEKADAPINHDGSFVLCGVSAGGGDAALVATDGVDTTGAILVQFPKHGLLRQDFAVGGRARVDIRVSNERGPMANAEAWLAGSIRPGSTDSTGVFRFPGARAGTQTLEVRAIGYLPERIPVSFVANRDTAIGVRLTSFRAVMDTIKVVAERVYWSDVRGFERRKKQGFGRFFDQTDIARRRPRDLLDLLRGVPGLRVQSSNFRYTVVSTRGPGHCRPALFVDGMPMHADLVPELHMLVRIDEVAGVEVYTGAGVPAEFASFRTCGAIVVWTRAPLPKR